MNPPASAGGFFLYARLPLARQRRRFAAHVRRCVCPRRCRGLTESVTARAVRLRLWSSGVPPARRQQGRVESRHAALRSAYRVMAECRRSATMSADVCGDVGGGETARAVGLRLWSSGVPPARRQQGRIESRHAALRSAPRTGLRQSAVAPRR